MNMKFPIRLFLTIEQINHLKKRYSQ